MIQYIYICLLDIRLIHTPFNNPYNQTLRLSLIPRTRNITYESNNIRRLI